MKQVTFAAEFRVLAETRLHPEAKINTKKHKLLRRHIP